VDFFDEFVRFTVEHLVAATDGVFWRRDSCSYRASQRHTACAYQLSKSAYGAEGTELRILRAI